MLTWLDIAIGAFGEPAIAFPEPIRTGRRCWAFFVNGHNFHIAIDVDGDRMHVWAGSPNRRAEFWTSTEPTDVEMRALCEYAWPGYPA